MPYLNLDPNYFDHPKTRRLLLLLGPMADILPLRLWAYCAKFHPLDGRLRGYSSDDIEAIIKWNGKPGDAVKKLVKSKFLLANKSGYSCSDWLQHEGHLSAYSRRGKEANRIRWGKVRAGIPVGVHNASKRNPPYQLNQPNQLNLTNQPNQLQQLHLNDQSLVKAKAVVITTVAARDAALNEALKK